MAEVTSLPMPRLRRSVTSCGTYSSVVPAAHAPSVMQSSMGTLVVQSFYTLADQSIYSVDLDIEGGSTAHYAAMIQQLRTHFNGASKSYYITGAPQCPFPDAYLGSVINAVAFDALYVQFCTCPTLLFQNELANLIF